MSEVEKNHESIIESLQLETAKIAWSDLQRFFAGGKVLLIDKEKDLLKIAAKMVQDDSQVISGWIDDGSIAVPSDELARQWYEENAILWAVVLKPWVLVQEVN